MAEILSSRIAACAEAMFAGIDKTTQIYLQFAGRAPNSTLIVLRNLLVWQAVEQAGQMDREGFLAFLQRTFGDHRNPKLAGQLQFAFQKQLDREGYQGFASTHSGKTAERRELHAKSAN